MKNYTRSILFRVNNIKNKKFPNVNININNKFEIV